MLKLRIVFAMIVLLIRMWRPLLVTISGGLAAAVICYRILVPDAMGIIGRGVVAAETISVALGFHLVTFLQQMLEMRGRLGQAEETLDGIFHGRRVNAPTASVVIGLLPSTGALLISGAIAKNSCGGCMSDEDMTLTTSLFRYIPGSFLPTYASILLTVMLSGIGAAGFVFFTLPIVAALFGLRYLFMSRKSPVKDKCESGVSKREAQGRFARSLRPIAFIVLLILAFGMPIYVATPVGITVDFLADRLSVKEILPVFQGAFGPAIIGNTIPVMIFENALAYVEMIGEFPVVFSQLPFSSVVISIMIFFVGIVISDSQVIITLCMPMAVTVVPAGGPPFVILLTCMTYTAMQVSPTHIYLFIAVEHFETQVGALMRRTLPVIACFCAATSVYAYALRVVVR